MSQQKIKQLLEQKLTEDGMISTGIKGVQLFRVTRSFRCAPAIYDPAVIAIVSGEKEAILNGEKLTYNNHQYLCCTMSMPVEAGTPSASPDNPLLGVYISLDTHVMTELAVMMENTVGAIREKKGPIPQGIELALWDNTFTDALLRLIDILDNPVDTAILGNIRLRELYYAVLKGQAGATAMRAFGVGNEIARSIAYLSSKLETPISVEDMAAQVGMSRAVFHRKFKQATKMSPIQFVKSMRLNGAAMKIAEGMNINEAAMNVGYVSTSQFSREFKRLYGQSPKKWIQSQKTQFGKAQQKPLLFDPFHNLK